MKIEINPDETYLLSMLVHHAISEWDEMKQQGVVTPGDGVRLDELLAKLNPGAYSFTCPAVMHHGPGSQSRTPCERSDPHGLDDEHYARNPMEPGFEWTGRDGWERR